ncbi:MAG: GIY-YIG nuclease family protein [Candidatus Gracilibacteria bacterium]|nr:GIY-YIG nuclease family protein [Candidatus Gracilibacteria bacterium]
MSGYIYITSNEKRGTLYIGVTSDITKRIWEHKNTVDPKCFTTRYNCKHLVYYEVFDNIIHAIEREKQLKNWHRDWKINLIEAKNPEWKDLYEDITS